MHIQDGVKFYNDIDEILEILNGVMLPQEENMPVLRAIEGKQGISVGAVFNIEKEMGVLFRFADSEKLYLMTASFEDIDYLRSYIISDSFKKQAPKLFSLIYSELNRLWFDIHGGM